MVSVQEAVQKSLQNHQPLFVFLSKDDETSQKFAEGLLEVNASKKELNISEKIRNEFVGLKLIEDSIEYGFFNQIFQNLVVPSFNIVNNGQLLDVITQECTRKQFVERISKISVGLNLNRPENLDQDRQTGTSLNAGSHDSFHSSAVVLDRQHDHNLDPRSPVNGITAEQDHDQNVIRYKRQIEAVRRAEQEEKKRIRGLLEADKRERHLRQTEAHHTAIQESSEIEREHTWRERKYDVCSLSIKLFDGNSLKHDFRADQTLNDVRSWLDTETEHQIIPNANASLPSFATASYSQPTHYVFHHPVLPRITYSDDQEFQKLSELELCPRSVLILKPIYDPKSYVNAYPNGKAPRGVLNSVGGTISKFGNAIYSFFDYSVGDLQHDYEAFEDVERPRSPLIDSEELGGNRPTDVNSNNETSLNSPAHERVEDYFDSRIRSGAGTPNVLSINSGSQPSLINFGSNPSPVPFSRIPSVQALDSTGNGTPSYNARSSTPKPINSIPSVSNIQTIHQGNSKKDSQKESKKDSGDKKTDRGTYNGNSINLGDHQDD